MAVVISLFSLPIITRIYDPATFGNFQILLSTVGLLSVISSFRYEMAIVLPKSQSEANAVFTLSCILLVIFTLIVSLVLYLFGQFLLKLAGAEVLIPYLHLLILAIFLSGIVQIARYVLTKENQFGKLGKNKVIESASAQGMKISFGLFSPCFLSLFISQLVGYIISIYLAMKRSSFKINISTKRLIFVFRKYKKFLFFNTPSIFVNTMALQLPIFMIARYFGTDFVAYYVLAIRLIEVPFKILGNSISQVYYKKASDLYVQGGGALSRLYKSTILKLALFISLPVILIFLFAKEIIPLLLGDNWTITGEVMSIIVVWKFFEFLNYPVSTSLTILNEQHIDLILKLFLSLGVRFIALILFNESFTQLLVATVISSSVYYMVFNFVSYKRILKYK